MSAIDTAVAAVLAEHSLADTEEVRAGVTRVAERWTDADGDEQAMASFCKDHWVPAEDRHRLRDRLETALEQIHGHLYEARRVLRKWTDTRGDDLPQSDDLLAQFDPAADLSEQLWKQKLGFLCRLHFDDPDLATMLAEGGTWSSDQWADARLSQAFGARIPAELSERSRHIGHAASKWVSEQHIPVGGVVTADGQAPFEPDRKLLWHWLVREELRGRYGDGADGLPVQRALASVMGRAIEGRIPATVWEGDAEQKWDPAANTIDGVAYEGEDLARYEHWLAQFRVQQELDPYHPKHPTVLGRRFDLQREIPETEVVALIETLLDSAARNDLLDVVEAKLGRPLEAHDVYFEELGDDRPSRELDAIVAARFPDEDAFDAALPEVLRGLGFGEDQAEFLGTRIDVEIARGAGHAVRPALPEFHSWLRTNRLPDTLGWDGFDTGMHELGHCLEQVISTHRPRPALRGVPNTACTEAFAFLYQHQARAVLGIAESGDRAGDIAAATSMLNACQIAGPALLEIRIWRWLYEHPEATPAQLRDEVVAEAGRVWDRFFRDRYGDDPYHLMAAYEHSVAYPLYLADYVIGLVMAQQIRTFVEGRDLSEETLRICGIGRVTPDAWMREAVGSGLDASPLLDRVSAAAQRLRD